MSSELIFLSFLEFSKQTPILSVTMEVMPPTLSPSNSGRRRTSNNASNSPEFEFWMAQNPSFPEPNLHSADELFVDGVIRPLHLLHHSDDHPDSSFELPTTASLDPSSDSGMGLEAPATLTWPEILATAVTSSKRWKDIFKKDSHGKKSNKEEKEKKKERKAAGGGGGNGTSAAELNIYLWPFSRSRSAGTGGSRPRMAPVGTRKVSSAPCSRSNSAGESKSRKWPSSPTRGGIHLGRSSPVWQVRRSGSGRNTADPLTRNAEKGTLKKEGNDICRSKPAVDGGAAGGVKVKVLNLNVPKCIGYRQPLSCKSNGGSSISVATAAGSSTATTSQNVAGIVTGESGHGSNVFNFRSLFTKKVY